MSTDTKKFVERQFEEVQGGEYDEFGFYHTPNGSFWDADGYYFNKEGKDKHGGYYNDDWEYVPGKDWDAVNQCYPGEENDFDDEDNEEFEEIDEDDIFDKINYEQNKEKLKFEEDVNSKPQKKDEIKEEKKQNNETNKQAGGLKGLLSGTTSQSNNDARPKGRPQTAFTRGGKK